MKRLLIALLATAVATPALAQHHGHHMPGHSMPMPKAKPTPKPKPKPPAAAPKPAAKKPAAKAKAAARPAAKAKPKAAAKKAPAKPVRKPAAKAAPKPAAPARDPHAGHDMATPSRPTADPHAGHTMPQGTASSAQEAQQADPHAGHDMGAAPAPQADPHAGHQMPMADAPAPPVAPPPAGAFSGPEHAADTVFGSGQMAPAREEMRNEHGGMTTYKLLVDQLEVGIRNGRDGYRWDAQGWIGGDIDKLWLKTEGEGAFGEAVEEAEVQALWSHAIDPWFDLQAGIRHDLRPDPERTHFVLGVQGLAPYWFEVDAAAFLSTKGDVTARVEAEYDLRLTQKLILQPRIEFDLAAQDVPELGIGSGLSAGELGARLRYEIRPEFAPYVGIEYERAFGGTADSRRASGEKAGGWNLLLGIRTWF